MKKLMKALQVFGGTLALAGTLLLTTPVDVFASTCTSADGLNTCECANRCSAGPSECSCMPPDY